MSNDVSAQLDVGGLSLSGLGAFSTVLTALSADDVQPMTMIQLQNLGAAFPTSGSLAIKVPDYLLRCQNRRIERLGTLVGWRRGDSASLMAQSAGGQAVALLAVCLWNIFGESTGDVFYKTSCHLLPQSSCISSPELLRRATKCLANKLAVIGFGTIIAKQICRIHDAYQQLQQPVPRNILEKIDEIWIAEFLVKVSRALREENGIVRVRGSYGMGYILAFTITLFADDCIVTLEDLIIHQGKRSSSISVEIVTSCADSSLEVHFMEKIETMADLFRGKYRAQYPTELLANADFAWSGHIAAFLRVGLQNLGLICSLEVIQAVGICALAISDISYIRHGHFCPRFPSVSILGENYRAVIHKRCEVALGLDLPSIWPPIQEAMALLKEAVKIMLENSQNTRSFYLEDWQKTQAKYDQSLVMILLNDNIWSTFKTFFMHPHNEATCRVKLDHSNPFSGFSNASDKFPQENNPLEWHPIELLKRVCSTKTTETVAWSLGSNTYVPSPYLTLDNDNICHYRGIEILDGPIIHNGRYHAKVTNPGANVRSMVVNHAIWSEIIPTSDGVFSDFSLAVVEKSRELVLETRMTVSGQRFPVCLAESMTLLFGLAKTTPCAHSRKTPLKAEYSKEVLVTSVAAHDPTECSSKIAVVQTAANPLAQILALTKNHLAILCHRCCLNCAFEQAKYWKACKIIVA